MKAVDILLKNLAAGLFGKFFLFPTKSYFSRALGPNDFFFRDVYSWVFVLIAFVLAGTFSLRCGDR